MADLSAYNPWAAPVFPSRDDNAMQPETYSNPLAQGLLSQLAGAIGRGFMAPGQALASTTPITSGQMVAPAMDMAGMTTLGAGAVPQEANTLNMGIKAYHGSPHDFNAFSMDKIGTGEGAQAYGHGLYFADNEGVAKSYRDALSKGARTTGGPGRVPVFTADGKEISASPATDIAQMMQEHKIDPSTKDGAEWLSSEIGARGLPSDATRQEIAALAGKNIEKKWQDGRMYEVNINADPAHFLDWDKPLSEQPPHVQSVMQELARRGKPEDTGARGYRLVSSGRTGTIDSEGWPEASQALRDAGIPGIKYLDQGSRSAGQGSSNYVVFNDKLIDILRKYAVPGMMGAPIFASQLGEQKS